MTRHLPPLSPLHACSHWTKLDSLQPALSKHVQPNSATQASHANQALKTAGTISTGYAQWKSLLDVQVSPSSYLWISPSIVGRAGCAAGGSETYNSVQECSDHILFKTCAETMQLMVQDSLIAAQRKLRTRLEWTGRAAMRPKLCSDR